MNNKKQAQQEHLIKEYRMLSSRLGFRPTREDLSSNGSTSLNQYYLAFDSWVAFLEEIGDLTTEERVWLDTPAEGFLRELERTRMSKAYKIPTILAFLKGERIVDTVTLTEIGRSFIEFYTIPEYQIDLSDQRHRGWQDWPLERWMKLAEENPVHFLSEGGNGYFSYNKATKEFSIIEPVRPHLSPLFAAHVADIIKYKTADYFRRHY